MSTRSIVIFGPRGCGKASQAARLQQHFGLSKVYDADCEGLTSARQLPRHDTLILTNTQPQRCPVRSMSFEQAVRQMDQAPSHAHG